MSKADAPSPHLAGHFRVVGVVPGRVYTPSHGTVDLRTIDLATAQALAAAGLPYLKAVKAKTTSTTKRRIRTEEAS